jgi:hypothetical protein
MTKHVFTKDNTRRRNDFFLKDEIEQWLASNAVPYEVASRMDFMIVFAHIVTRPEPLSELEVPWLQYTLNDEDNALLFKLTWGDHFEHTVVEDDKE